MMQRKERTTPERMDLFPSGEIGVVWKDGHESIYGGHYLRCHCPCAGCVEEGSGRKILVDALVPADVRPRICQGVGNYGVQIVWSDGHSTGIYAHTLLRSLCPCPACAGDRR